MTTRTLHHLIIAISVCTMLLGLAVILTERAALKATADEGEGTACHTITSSDAQVDSKYGSPVSFFNNSPLLLRVQCENDGALSVFAGTGASAQYIYQFGYRKVGTSWERIKFTGAKRVGSWFLGSASTTISARDAGAQGTVLAYVCENVQGSWKCGCSDKACTQAKWQVQKYAQKTGETSQTATKEETEKEKKVKELLEQTRWDGATGTKPYVYSISNGFVLPGEKLTLAGDLLSKKPIGNEVQWVGSEAVQHVTSPDGYSLTLTTPNIPPGKYNIKVRTEGGLSEQDIIIWVRDAKRSKPTITGITPNTAKVGDTITITGNGFSAKNNDVISLLGIMQADANEDGTQITLRYKPSGSSLAFREHATVDVHVTVANEGGFSNFGTFTLEL